GSSQGIPENFAKITSTPLRAARFRHELSLPALPVAAGWAPGSSVEVSAVTASLTNMSSIGLFNQRRAQAIALRRAGRSRRDIKEILGITSNATLDRALRGEPPPAWTLRPRAKDGLRARARDLRAQGLDYDDIAAARESRRAQSRSGSATCRVLSGSATRA